MWHYWVTGCFDWKIVVFQQTVERVYYILKGLNQDVNKISQCSGVALKIVKENIDNFSDFFCAIFYSSIKLTKLPKNFKLVNITMLQKKGEKDIEGSIKHSL